ncbi:hypothetical protein P9869_39355 [Streptomyces ossamyceticus]|nr:hypothetical protein [Streptomyces ossamyceticus]
METERWTMFRSWAGLEVFSCQPGTEGAHEQGGVEGGRPIPPQPLGSRPRSRDPKAAGFPREKAPRTFDFDANAAIDPAAIHTLASCTRWWSVGWPAVLLQARPMAALQLGQATRRYPARTRPVDLGARGDHRVDGHRGAESDVDCPGRPVPKRSAVGRRTMQLTPATGLQGRFLKSLAEGGCREGPPLLRRCWALRLHPVPPPARAFAVAAAALPSGSDRPLTADGWRRPNYW